MRLWHSLLVFAVAASAQPPTRPPVILVNGYQISCDAGAPSSATFGQMETLLRGEGYTVHFFNNCSVRSGGLNRPTIEELGQAFGTFVDSLNVPQVDVVAHSMGALIARCYLTGKQNTPGRFSPPQQPKLRKLVMLGGSNYGFTGPLLSLAIDVQALAQVPGSRFLLELATWNQGSEDMREVESVAVAGTAAGASDGLVAITAAALPVANVPERTRVLPYCHTDGLTLIGGCRPGAPLLANVNSADHMSYRIVSSFLGGTDEWRRIGETAASDATLSKSNGLLLSYRDAEDNFVGDVSKVTYAGGELNRARDNYFYYKEALAPGAYKFEIQSASHSTSAEWTAAGGAYSVLTVKEGPQMTLVMPAAARVATLNRAPGSFISIYGTNLAQSTNQAGSLPLPEQLDGVSVLFDDRTIPLQYVSPGQINAVLPETTPELARMTVRTPAGSHTINLKREEAVPAVFSLSGGGTGPAAAIDAVSGVVITQSAPARVGTVIALYATGLGPVRLEGGLRWAVNQPQVTLGGVACQLLYAGRAPDYPGLDQINFIVPPGVRAGAAALLVRSLARTSNETTLAVR
jgi:uncharacterized protein (TIGR03437 family)